MARAGAWSRLGVGLLVVVFTCQHCSAWQEEGRAQEEEERNNLLRLRHTKKSFVWVEEQGGASVVESCCDVVALPHGELGLEATKSFAEGDEVYRVPKALHMSLANMPGAASDETVRAVMEMVQRKQYQVTTAADRPPMQTHALMAAFLLLGTHDGHGAQSFWRKYLRSMPHACGGTNNPMLYELYVARQKSDVLNYLLQKDALFSDMFRPVHEAFEDVRLFFSNTIPNMFTGDDYDVGDFSPQDIAWAVCMAFSRGFGPAGAFVPVLDLLNTANVKAGQGKDDLNTRILYDGNGDVAVVATRSIQPGDELLVDYKTVFSTDMGPMAKEIHLIQYGVPSPFVAIDTDTVYVPLARFEDGVRRKLGDVIGKQLAAAQKRALDLVTKSSPLSNSHQSLLRGGGWLGFPVSGLATLSLDDAPARLLIGRMALIKLVLPGILTGDEEMPQRPLDKRCAKAAISLQNTCGEEPNLLCHAISLGEHAMKPLMEMCDYAEEMATRGDITFTSCAGCPGPLADIMNGKCSMAQSLLRALQRIGKSEWNCTYG